MRPNRPGGTFLAPPADELPRGPRPTFSVIIAAYQAADVISDALESIRAQTLKPLEVIVCDDGSTDDLERALEPYAAEILLVRKEHGGEASAKNAAAAAASGDFLLVLDADDVYLPGRVYTLTELARARPDLDILTTNGVLVANGRPVRFVYDRTWTFDTADQRRAILQRNFIFGLAAVRRAAFQEYGGFDESILWTTDWDLWLRMILGGAGAGCVDEPLAHYRLRESSLTARRRELIMGRLATLEKARGNQALRSVEREHLEASIAEQRRTLALLDLRAAVAGRQPGVRRWAAGIARQPAYTLGDRLEALAMAAVPGVAGRVLRRRAASAWVGAGGVRVPRASTAGDIRARG
jgi:hypothetical protein